MLDEKGKCLCVEPVISIAPRHQGPHAPLHGTRDRTLPCRVQSPTDSKLSDKTLRTVVRASTPPLCC